MKQYEPVPGQQFEQPDSEDEKLCDEERYRSLRSDMSEEQLYQGKSLIKAFVLINAASKHYGLLLIQRFVTFSISDCSFTCVSFNFSVISKIILICVKCI